MVDIPLCTLIVSNKPDEIEQIKANIRSFAPCSIFVIAESEQAFKNRLSWLNYQLIVCDSQLQAYKINMHLQVQMPYLPFLLITDRISSRETLRQFRSMNLKIASGIERSNLTQSSAVFKTVYAENAAQVENEQSSHIALQRVKLLLQKLQCLLDREAGRLDEDLLAQISRSLFGYHQETVETACS